MAEGSLSGFSKLLYSIEENPPWPLTIFLGLQHYLLMFVSSATTPLIFASALCLPIDGTDVCDVINTLIFISGITTLIQTIFGSRLPIVQGPSYAFLVPLISMMAQHNTDCPLHHNYNVQNGTTDSESYNNSDLLLLNTTREAFDMQVQIVWKTRMREVQGAIILASIVQILSGTTGLMLFIFRFIGPLTITPTIAMVGLAFFDIASEKCSLQWGIAFLTIVLVTVYSQYLARVCVTYRTSRESKVGIDDGTTEKLKFPIFSMFSLIFAMATAWLVCFILTMTGVLGETADKAGYHAKTDLNLGPIKHMAWFRMPYPMQWGLPTFSVSGVLGMVTAVFVSMIESIGDYYACAKVSGAPVPPPHAINRGLAAEGFGGILAGLFGTGLGSTSFSQNIAVIGITKVGSRRMVQVAAMFMIILSLLGKFSAVFVTIPQPIIGGVFFVVFGMVASVGLSNLQYVDLASSRNQYILGLSLLTGLTIPYWTRTNAELIRTGIPMLDSILYILMTTGMFLAGLVGCVLDNTIPGTIEERGIIAMNSDNVGGDDSPIVSSKCYEVPYTSQLIERYSWTTRVPFCHNFEGFRKPRAPALPEDVEMPTEEAALNSKC